MAKLIRPVISIDDWLSSEFYIGPEVPFIRPYVKQFLTDYFHGKKRDFICTGASRTGKSYAVRILIIRILYEMSCYQDFPTLFGLSPSTLPKIIWFSFTKGKSSTTGISAIIRMIDKIPYFQDPSVRRKDLDSEIVFPFCQIMSGSNVTHAVGEDLLGAIIDEANVRHVAAGHEVEEAQKMFLEIRQRSVMTFSKNGMWGGFSGIISSSGTTTSFTAVQLEKAKHDNSSVVMECSVYKANPEQYSKETFDVFTGNGTIQAFIVDTADDTIKNSINTTYGILFDDFIKQNQNFIEKVPCSIRHFYEEDLSFSLMNMSGITQTGTNFFVTNKNLITGMFVKNMKGSSLNVLRDTPCPVKFPEMGIYDTTSIYDLFTEDNIMNGYNGENVYLHMDPSQKWDRFGFSALYYSTEIKKICSLLTISFTIGHEMADNQIDQEKILQLILYLRDLGVKFKYITGDHYAKDFLIPQCKKIFGNECSDYFSVDTTTIPYLTTLNYMKKKMYVLPYYDELEYELSHLLFDRFTNTIDHPHNTDSKHPVYFKDCSDALAGASQHIYTREQIHYEDDAPKEQEEIDEEIDDGFYDGLTDENEDYESDEEKFISSLEN